MKIEDQLSEKLKKSGLKITPIRIAVLKIFSKSSEPLDAEHLFLKLRSKKTDRATIHRTLKSLEEKEIIKRVDLRKNSTFFELSEKHCHYMVCVDCGLTENFEGCFMEDVSKKLVKKSKNFKKIKDHSLELFGLCR